MKIFKNLLIMGLILSNLMFINVIAMEEGIIKPKVEATVKVKELPADIWLEIFKFIEAMNFETEAELFKTVNSFRSVNKDFKNLIDKYIAKKANKEFTNLSPLEKSVLYQEFLLDLIDKVITKRAEGATKKTISELKGLPVNSTRKESKFRALMFANDKLNEALKMKAFKWAKKQNKIDLNFGSLLTTKLGKLLSDSKTMPNIDKVSTLLKFSEGGLKIANDDLLNKAIESDRSPELISLLLGYGIDPNRGALYSAIATYDAKNYSNVIENIKLLLKYNAKPDLMFYKEMSPRNFAKETLSDQVYKKQGKIAWAYGKAKGWILDVDEKNDDQGIKNLKIIVKLLSGKTVDVPKKNEKLEEGWKEIGSEKSGAKTERKPYYGDL